MSAGRTFPGRLLGRGPGGSGGGTDGGGEVSYSWGANKLLEAESSGCLRLQPSLQPMVESL